MRHAFSGSLSTRSKGGSEKKGDASQPRRSGRPKLDSKERKAISWPAVSKGRIDEAKRREREGTERTVKSKPTEAPQAGERIELCRTRIRKGEEERRERLHEGRYWHCILDINMVSCFCSRIRDRCSLMFSGICHPNLPTLQMPGPHRASCHGT